jgi:hypothetical protein
MVAVEKTIASKDSDAEASVCPECRGAGTVGHWSDVAYFEDRRVCTNCEAGRAVDSRIADIVRRAQLEQRLSSGSYGRSSGR